MGTDGGDDDGEERAGSALRAELRREKVAGAAVVVARWYGGVNIGKARFRHVQERAIILLRACGHKSGRTMAEATSWEHLGGGYRLSEASCSSSLTSVCAAVTSSDAMEDVQQRRERAAAAA